jgi:hypothetical protein
MICFSPASFKAFTRLLPTNPAAPVTIMVMLCPL